MLNELNERSQEIFRHIIEIFCDTGEPIGSHVLSQRMRMRLSSATIRTVMSKLESMGLLYSPHTSSGRLPTEKGLKLFVDGLLQVGSLEYKDQDTIQKKCQDAEHDIARLLEQAVSILTGLTQCAGLVMAPKADSVLKHIEVVSLGLDQALVVLVNEGGVVENRLISIPKGVPQANLIEAANYLNARLIGESMGKAREKVLKELKENKAQLSSLAQQVVQAGLGVWEERGEENRLIVKGQAHLLKDINHLDDLERLKNLFKELEEKENLLRLLDAVIAGEGVKIYIGSQNNLFNMSGCSLIVSPYHNKNDKIIGAIGVIGPMHINYARIVPIVDYTAKLVSQLMDK